MRQADPLPLFFIYNHCEAERTIVNMPYKRKLCWNSATAKTRILISIEIEGSHFVVTRKGKKMDWKETLSVSPFPVLPASIAEFATEREAVAFADDLVERYIKGEQFRECPDEADDEFGS
jgi:hypothetical protein